MSGTKVANLFAEVGFKISNQEIEAIKNAFSSIKDKIDELVAKTAEFATSLTRLSKSTGISPRTLQDFHNLGVEAGIAADEVDSMLNTMANVANKAYWGLGNQFAQWGLFFGRGETAASALLKVLNKLNVSSPQKQREIANEIGLSLDAALMMADKLKKSGFKTEDYFNLSEKEVDTMHSVNIELAMMGHRVDNFWKKLTASQGENQLRNLHTLNKVIKSITTSTISAANTGFGKGLLDSLITGVQIIEPVLKHGGQVIDAFKLGFRGIKYLGIGALVTSLGFVLTKLVSLNPSQLFKDAQNWLSNILNTTGAFGKGIKDSISSAADYALDVITKYFSETSDLLGITRFLKDLKKGDLFTGLERLLNRWWTALSAGAKAAFRKAKNLGLYVWDLFSGGFEKLINWAWDTLSFNVFKPLMLQLYKGLDALPMVDLSEEIKSLEEELGNTKNEPEDLSKRLNISKKVADVVYDVREKDEPSIYDAVRKSLMNFDEYLRDDSFQSGLKHKVNPDKEARANRRNTIKYFRTQNLLNNPLPNDITNNSINNGNNQTYHDNSVTNIEINESKTPRETGEAVRNALSSEKNSFNAMQNSQLASNYATSSGGGFQ